MTLHAPIPAPQKRPLTVRLATPRGFCAGVDRAIQIVERAIEKYGAPVYVRHEIVHNRHVVDRLKAMGAVFVRELDECPDDRPVVFSAHGVPKSVPEGARAREVLFLDATCPLVSKVHVEAERHHAAGRHIILIGHAGHPEVVGTMGQLPPGAISLVEVAMRAGAKRAELIDDADQINWSWFEGVNTLGVTAGASAPESLVQGVIDAVAERFDVELIHDDGARETVTFKLPRVLTAV